MALSSSLLGSSSGSLVSSTLKSEISKDKLQSLLGATDTISGKLQGADDKSIESAAKTFEGMLISQMMDFMFESVDVDQNFGGGFAEDMTRSMLTDKYGEIMAKSGGIGISDAIQKQLLMYQQQTATNV